LYILRVFGLSTILVYFEHFSLEERRIIDVFVLSSKSAAHITFTYVFILFSLKCSYVLTHMGTFCGLSLSG